MLLLLGLTATLQAAPTVEVGGDVKTFSLATFPYDHIFFRDPSTWADPDAEAEPTGQGLADLRLKAGLRWGRALSLQAHHALTTRAPGHGGLMPTLAEAGVGLSAPEALPLSWEAADGPGLAVGGRVDRLVLLGRMGRADLSIGRQPVTFGHSLIFTPMDLVGPFNPMVIDQEYKPGVDALRLDLYGGTSNKLTLAAAYAGGWDLPGAVLAAHGNTTVDVWDIGLFLGMVRQDMVAGLSTSGSMGAVSVRAEATVTVPPEDSGEDLFVRSVAGATVMPGLTGETSITAEVYLQTIGAPDPSGYFDGWQSDRVARGELWLVGRYYAALVASHQLLPILTASAALVANLADPSALLAPTIAWSASDEVELAAGAFFGLGQRPDPLEVHEVLSAGDAVNSELGLLPSTAYLSMKASF